MSNKASSSNLTAIVVRTDSNVPKYRQIIESILRALASGRLQKGDLLPSINEVSARWSLARETVVRAYAELREKGILSSQPGKGFYVATSHIVQAINVFVMFDVLLAPYKERLYDGIRENLKGRAHLDFYFHHYNPDVFRKLLSDAQGSYEYYVVMPFPNDVVRDALASFDQDKLLLLDIDVDYPGKRCAVIRQDHNTELVRALDMGIERIRLYERLTLVFHEDRNHPAVIPGAFRRFCKRQKIEHRVIPKLRETDLRPHVAYLVIEDEDLVRLVKFARSRKLRIGRDIGIISYNDTPLKEVIEDGITVVSVDFREMGRRTAHEILHRERATLLQPTELIFRGSL